MSFTSLHVYKHIKEGLATKMSEMLVTCSLHAHTTFFPEILLVGFYSYNQWP